MTQKHTKYSPEWEQKNKFIIGKQIEKEFKKGEKKPDDTEVTADTEKVKVNDYEDLIREREALKVDYEAKKEVVKTKSGYAGKFVEMSMEHDRIADKVENWKKYLRIANAETGRTNDGNYNNQSNSFLTSGSGAANPYRTKGWFKLIADWNNKPFTPTTAGATAKDYTNLYEVCFNSGYNQMSIKMTENELIKFITRTLKEYEKIDTTTTGETFQDYLTTKKPATVSIVYTDYGTTTTPDVETDTIVNGYLTTLKAHAKNLVETTDEKTGRKEYAFGHNFVNDNGTGMKDTPFGKAEIETFIKLTNFLNNNHVWVLHEDVKKSVLKDIPHKTELTFIPAQDKPYTEGKLHELGQENYTDSSFANSDKATKFYKDIPKKDWAEKAVKYEIGGSDVYGGIYEWGRLVSSSLQIHYNENAGRLVKFVDSFDNNPYVDFWQDLETTDEFGSFNDRAATPHYYTLLDFPKHAYEQEIRAKELEGLMKAELERLGKGGEELRTAQEEADQAHKKVKEKEQEINDLITARLKEKREVLKTKYKFDATTAPNFGSGTDANDANRLTYIELLNIQSELWGIRHAETGDEEKESSVPNENTALERIKELISESDIHTIRSLWDNVGWEKDKPQKSTEEKIAIIKENKGGEQHDYNYWNLNKLHDMLVETEKKMKLTDEYVEIKNKLKEAIEKQTPQENIKDWQNVVKKYEAGLETVFDQAKIDKWKEKKDGQDAFTNTTGIEKLIKKISIFKKGADDKDEFEKINDEFLTFAKGQDAKYKTLADIFKEEPKKVITLIYQWEYNKLDETKKKERWLKFAWSEKGGKKIVDSYDLPDSEKAKFDEYLYECAIGKINESTLTKPTEKKKDDDENKNKEMSAWKEWFGFGSVGKSLLSYGLIIAVILGGCAFYWWDDLKAWWNKVDDDENKEED